MKTATQHPATAPLLTPADFQRIAVKSVPEKIPVSEQCRRLENLSTEEQLRRLLIRAAARWEPRA